MISAVPRPALLARRLLLRVSLGLFLAGSLAGVLGASTIVVPNGLENVPGHAGGNAVANAHFQQIYDSSQFPAFPIEISAISFRLDEDFGPFTYTNPSLTMILSTSRTTVLSPSPIFNNNLSADAKVVLSGPVTYGSNSTSFPRAFDIVFHLSDVFDYNPALGPLILDVKSSGYFSGNVPWDFCDYATDCDNVLNSFGATPMDATEAPGVGNFGGYVTQFTYSPIPEPPIWPIMILAYTGLIGVVRRR